MINQSDLPKHNITSLDSGQRHNDKQKATLQALKQLIPEIINSDGQLNIEALKDVIDIAQTTANNKGYELTFAGKGLAKAKASSATAYELQSEKQQSKNFDETQGISWEPHPMVIVPNRNIHTAMARNLDSDGCKVSKELIQLFGFDGLARDSGENTIVITGVSDEN